jgi:hypothetical protein
MQAHDLAVGAVGVERGGNDRRSVDHQHVAGLEGVAQVAERPVGDAEAGAPRHHEPHVGPAVGAEGVPGEDLCRGPGLAALGDAERAQ